jgi:hypothetical protein
LDAPNPPLPLTVVRVVAGISKRPAKATPTSEFLLELSVTTDIAVEKSVPE